MPFPAFLRPDVDDALSLLINTAVFLSYASQDAEAAGGGFAHLEELNTRRGESYVSPLSFAIIHIGLGQLDDAFHWLELARQVADPWLTENNFDPVFDPVRAAARWRKLRSEMGFAEM